MKIILDTRVRDFNFWSGASNNVADLTDAQWDNIERTLDEVYPEGMTDTQLNDLFWFDFDTVKSWAGISDYPKYFKIVGPRKNECVIAVDDEDEERQLKDVTHDCEVTELNENQPVEADEDFCFWNVESFIYDEDNMYDSYSIPNYAICAIENGDFSGLENEDIDNINKFLADLDEAIPNGYVFDWDKESLESPYFSSNPKFGLPADCVLLRVYELKQD